MKPLTWLFIGGGVLVVAVLVFLGVWYFTNESDKVGEEFQPTMNAAERDLDDFWDERFDELGFGEYYESPDRVEYYDPEDPQQTACGETIPNNAFYCPPDNSIWMDEVFLENQFDTVGAFAPVFILAHEWAHMLQQHLGILEAISFTIQTELQADCFAGVYTRDLDERDLITEENLKEAIVQLIQVGDPAIIPWWAPSAHGEPEERVTAYVAGYDGGWDACIEDPPFVPPMVDPAN